MILYCKCGADDCQVTLEISDLHGGDASPTLYYRNRGLSWFFDLGEEGAKSLASELLGWLGRNTPKSEVP